MGHDQNSLAENWVALWQSEMTAMAADRELRESWTGMLALWANATNAALQQASRSQNYEYSTGSTGSAANRAADAAEPAGSTPAAAASVISGDEARRLHERIAELESRLSKFERRGRKPARPRTS